MVIQFLTGFSFKFLGFSTFFKFTSLFCNITLKQTVFYYNCQQICFENTRTVVLHLLLFRTSYLKNRTLTWCNPISTRTKTTKADFLGLLNFYYYAKSCLILLLLLKKEFEYQCVRIFLQHTLQKLYRHYFIINPKFGKCLPG